MIASATIAAWVVILLDKSETIAKLYTFVYMFAVLTITPLLTNSTGAKNIEFSFINIVLVTIFIVHQQNNPSI